MFYKERSKSNPNGISQVIADDVTLKKGRRMSIDLPKERTGQRPAPRARTVEVRRVSVLSPKRRRVHFGGEDLEGFALQGPAGHLKLYLPQPGQDGIDFAALAMPRGTRPPSAPISRTFTPRRFTESNGELDVDFYIHGDGPASIFARMATSGQVVAISGPSRPYHLSSSAWQLIVGDETAFPAIETIVEATNEDAKGVVIFEVGDVADLPKLVERSGITVLSAVRVPGEPVGAAMIRTLADVLIPDSEIQVFIAGESITIRQARTMLLGRGLLVGQLTTRGYWRDGEANHPDHDMGDD